VFSERLRGGEWGAVGMTRKPGWSSQWCIERHNG